MKKNPSIDKINWNKYKIELDAFVDQQITDIQKLLKKEFFINENKLFYYKIFFLPLSKYFFNKKYNNNLNTDNFSETNKLSHLINLFTFIKSSLSVECFDSKKVKWSKNISLSFFFRHSEFKTSKLKSISEINSVLFKKKFKFKMLYIYFKLIYSELKKNEVLQYLKPRIIILLINYNFLKKLRYQIKNIFISNHGIMRDVDQVLLGCLSKHAKIYSIQSGYSHFMIKYYDKVDYITKISKKVLVWGVEKNINHINIGSFYSLKKKKISSSSVVILPQIPQRNFKIPISSYWSLNNDEFKKNVLIDLILDIKKLIIIDKACVLQCKKEDFRYYKFYLKKYKIRNKLICTDVNNEKYSKCYKKTYVLAF